MKLSIVTGTLNRLPYLKNCIASLAPSCEGIAWELIVIDGGSTDGTLKWLYGQCARHDNYILIEQGKPLGCVRAFNAGFSIAAGEYVANLNDDCVVVGDTLRQACSYLDVHPRVGQLAIPYANDGNEPKVSYMRPGANRRWLLYANFGVTRRVLGDQLGWWSDYLEHYAGDCELSTNLWAAGWQVEIASGRIIHYEADDATRRRDGSTDSNLFYGKWHATTL